MYSIYLLFSYIMVVTKHFYHRAIFTASRELIGVGGFLPVLRDTYNNKPSTNLTAFLNKPVGYTGGLLRSEEKHDNVQR